MSATKSRANVMFSMIVSKAPWRRSERIDPVTKRTLPHMGAEHPAIHDIDSRREQSFDEVHDIRVVEYAERSGRIEIEHYVEIAVGPRLVACNGAEQSGVENAPPTELSLMAPKNLQCLRAFHDR